LQACYADANDLDWSRGGKRQSKKKFSRETDLGGETARTKREKKGRAKGMQIKQVPSAVNEGLAEKSESKIERTMENNLGGERS